MGFHQRKWEEAVARALSQDVPREAVSTRPEGGFLARPDLSLLHGFGRYTPSLQASLNETIATLPGIMAVEDGFLDRFFRLFPLQIGDELHFHDEN